jgi:hypothetical protein
MVAPVEAFSLFCRFARFVRSRAISIRPLLFQGLSSTELRCSLIALYLDVALIVFF